MEMGSELLGSAVLEIVNGVKKVITQHIQAYLGSEIIFRVGSNRT